MSSTKNIEKPLKEFLVHFQDDKPKACYGSIDPKRSLNIGTRADLKLFWESYSSLSCPRCITERQPEGYASVVIDYDKVSSSYLSESEARAKYLAVARTVHDALTECVVSEGYIRKYDRTTTMLLLTKPQRPCAGGGFKFGFHLQIPDVLMEQKHRAALLAYLKTKDDNIDPKPASGAWLLYGSAKNLDPGSRPYLLLCALKVTAGSVKKIDGLEHLAKLYCCSKDEIGPKHFSIVPYVQYQEGELGWTHSCLFEFIKPLGMSLDPVCSIDDGSSDDDGASAEIDDDDSSDAFDAVVGYLCVNGMAADFSDSCEPGQNGFSTLKRIRAGTCPVTKAADHDRLGLWFRKVGQHQVLLGCFSDGCKGRHKKINI